MKTIFLTVVIIATCYSSFGQSISPQVVNTTGGTHRKGYYILDWSVGELALVDQLTSSDQAFIITNGFLQAFTESPGSIDTTQLFTSEEVRILPNPTYGKLEVDFLTQQKGQLKIYLFDAVGTLLYTKQVSGYGYGRFERIDMTNFANSTYILYVELKATPGSVNKKGYYKINKVK